MQWNNYRPGTRIRPNAARQEILPTVISPIGQEGLVTLGLRRGKTTADILRYEMVDSPYGGGDQEQLVRSVGTYFVDINPVLQPVETIDAGAVQGIAGYEIYFPRNADVRGSDRIAIPGWLPAWEANQVVAPKKRVLATGDFGNGHFYECVQGGTTGTAQPDWPLGQADRVSDGTAIWQEAGLAFVLEVKGTDDKKTSDSNLVVRAEEVK